MGLRPFMGSRIIIEILINIADSDVIKSVIKGFLGNEKQFFFTGTCIALGWVKAEDTQETGGEDKNLGNYQVPVCYGNLNCSLISDGPLACKAAGEQTIFRLSDVTNAHAKGSSGPGGYNQILCCNAHNPRSNGAYHRNAFWKYNTLW